MWLINLLINYIPSKICWTVVSLVWFHEPENVEKVQFPAPKSVINDQFKAPDISKKAWNYFRGLKSSKRCVFRRRKLIKNYQFKAPDISNKAWNDFRGLKTSKRCVFRRRKTFISPWDTLWVRLSSLFYGQFSNHYILIS